MNAKMKLLLMCLAPALIASCSTQKPLIINSPEYIGPPNHLTAALEYPRWESGGSIADLGIYASEAIDVIDECNGRFSAIRKLSE